MTTSPLSQYHHYHNITTITTSPLWQITTITTTLSQYGSLARNAFLKVSACTKCCVLQDKTCPGRWMGKLVRRTVARRSRHVSAMFGSWSDRPRIGTASSGFISTVWTFKIWRQSRTKASFSYLPLSGFEGGLARKLRFHIFDFQILREVSHESFVFTSCTFTFSGKSRTTASFSHLPLSGFEGSLAQKASFSHLQPSVFEGSLERKLRFHIFSFLFLREVSHENFVFTSSAFCFWGKSRRKASFSHLPLSVFEGTHLQNSLFKGSLARSGAAVSDAVARSSFVLRNSVFADRIVMAASRLLGAAAVCLVLLAFLQLNM